ncbi:Smr/MutS family protein [Brytella acorum]
MARRTLGEDEAALWSAFARGIKPLKSAKARKAIGTVTGKSGDMSTRSVDASATGMPLARAQKAPARVWLTIGGAGSEPPRKTVSMQTAVEIGVRRPGLDDTSWRALSTGRMRPQRTLDLHGHFAQDAFEELHAFLARCSAHGIRCVEVVTGLGSGREGGVIRRELPLWLGRADLKPMILAVVHTHARNHGAVRILLRARQAGRRPGNAP